jgi:hypothetical protein
MGGEYLGKIKLGSVCSMTQVGCWALLERHHEIALATVDSDGVIYNSPVWYSIKDKRIFIPIDQASAHYRNMQDAKAMTARKEDTRIGRSTFRPLVVFREGQART